MLRGSQLNPPHFSVTHHAFPSVRSVVDFKGLLSVLSVPPSEIFIIIGSDDVFLLDLRWWL